MKLDFLARMRMPLSAFKRDPMEKVIGAAKRCLDTPEGEILLKYLITEYRLDEPLGADADAYVTGTQDVLKHILSLINDK